MRLSSERSAKSHARVHDPDDAGRGGRTRRWRSRFKDVTDGDDAQRTLGYGEAGAMKSTEEMADSKE
jgi:hypothetical protein